MSAYFELREVTVERGGQRILDRVSLRLEPGERLALTGANGAGKTTLLRTLVGLETPSSGDIIAFGQVRRQERDFRAVRAQAGLVFQDPDDQLFSPTVIEDVAFGPLNLGLSPRAAAARAQEVLAQLGLEHLTHRVIDRLSSGEKRMVSLAGVLAMQPLVLLLDEPTNALDEHYRTRLIDCLTSLSVAMILVSHDRGFLACLANRAVLLQQGQIIVRQN